MGEEKPLVLKLNDGGVGGVRVAGNLADDAHGGVGPTYVVGDGVGYLFRPFGGVGQVVLAVVLVYPRGFGEAGQVDLVYLAVNLRHVVL